MKDRVVSWAYAAGWAVVKALPERVARRVFDLGARLAYRRQGKGTRRLAANLARIVPPDQVEATTREGLRAYARYWLEVFRLPVTKPETIVARIECRGEERLRGRAANGAGPVAVLPHMGNWDIAGAWASIVGIKLMTVAERLKPEGLFDRFLEFRQSLGMEVVPLTGGDSNPFDLLADRVRAGSLACLVGDRDLTARGVEVTFFGATAKFPAGPAALALRTGGDLLPVALWRQGDGYVIDVMEPVPPSSIAAMTQEVANRWEAAIREHPADWHMLQRLWVDDLVPR